MFAAERAAASPTHLQKVRIVHKPGGGLLVWGVICAETEFQQEKAPHEQMLEHREAIHHGATWLFTGTQNAVRCAQVEDEARAHGKGVALPSVPVFGSKPNGNCLLRRRGLR